MNSLFLISTGFLSTLFLEARAQQVAVTKDSAVTKFFQRTTGWIASDGGLSVNLSDGRTLWLMGDSHIDDYDTATGTIPCLFQVRNAALLQPAGDWNSATTKTLIGTGPGIKSLFKRTTDNKLLVLARHRHTIERHGVRVLRRIEKNRRRNFWLCRHGKRYVGKDEISRNEGGEL